MRSAEGSETKADCEDPMIKAACLIDDDSCPAECKGSDSKDEKEDTVVKSGDLEVSVESNKGADAFLYGGTSDLDTINFKASEEGITVTKVTLERFGYSSSADVANVWLEDANGTRITDPKELNSKDLVTLSINKDYRTLDEKDSMTIILQTTDGKAEDYKAGSSIGFKVVSIETSAANVDESDITGKPYLYDLVSYDGSNVVVTYKGKGQTYHIGEGPYEVFRFKLKAPSTSAALVKGFEVTNVSKGTKLDLKDFVKDVTVTVNDEKVKNVNYSIDDDKLSVNFDEVEIAVKENAIFAMSIDLDEDFDELGSAVLFELAEASDLKVTEKKTGARVSIEGFADLESDAEYIFNGSKINLSNEKLGTVNMAAGSEDVAIAEGTIELGGQSIVIAGDTIAVKATNKATAHDAKWTKGAGIVAMRLVVAGEEFDAKCVDAADYTTTCTFNKKITLEKEGKFQIVVDVDDEDYLKDTTIGFTVNDTDKALFGKTTIGTDAKGYIKGFTYEDSKKGVLPTDFVGSITLYDLKVTAAKASMENKLNTAAEFKTETTTSKIPVFEGTYTAKKHDITLTDVNYYIETALKDADDSVTFNLYVNDKLVSSTDIDSKDATGSVVNDTTTRTKIAAGETVNVKVLADVYPTSEYTVSYKVELVGEDSDGNTAGKASDYTVEMKFVEQGSADIEALQNSTHKQKDVLLRAANLPIAAFRVNASNGKVDLDDMLLTISKGGVAAHCSDAAIEDEEHCVNSPAVEAKGAIYSFVSYNNTDEEPYYTGTVEVIGTTGTNYTIVKVLTNEVEDFLNHEYVVKTDVIPSEGALQLFENDDDLTETTLYVKNLVLEEEAVEAQEAVEREWIDATEGTPVKASAIKIKINGEDVDEDKITDDGDNIYVEEIAENDIDEKGVEVIVSLKGTPTPDAYVVNLKEVNGEEKGIIFNKNIVPALLTIEQTDLHGSTQFKFTVTKYDSSNTVSNVCFYDEDGDPLGKCLTTNISNGSILEIGGGYGVQLVGYITYDVAGTNGGSVVIDKETYNDYFKVGNTYLKVFDKDSK